VTDEQTGRYTGLADTLGNRLAQRLIEKADVTPYKQVDNENDRLADRHTYRHIGTQTDI
jgi:hypothetical protein